MAINSNAFMVFRLISGYKDYSQSNAAQKYYQFHLIKSFISEGRTRIPAIKVAAVAIAWVTA
jgi:hypothetical protein